MPELFRRAWDIRVGGIQIAGEGAGGGAEQQSLDCAFEITKSTAREPNTARVQIYNLSRSNRQQLRQTRGLAISVRAGYVNAIGLLFDGQVRNAQSRPGSSRRRHRSSEGSLLTRSDVVDIITEIEAEDGGTGWRNASVNRSFAAGTPVTTVLGYAVDALGIGRGNLAELGAAATMNGISAYTEGTVLSGRAHNEVNRIVRSLGLTWSIQNGTFQLKEGRRALATRAVLLSPETGLIGSPSADVDGLVTAISLLNIELYPSRPVVLESANLEGSYQVKRVTHSGDTSADWQSEVILELR